MNRKDEKSKMEKTKMATSAIMYDYCGYEASC